MASNTPSIVLLSLGGLASAYLVSSRPQNVIPTSAPTPTPPTEDATPIYHPLQNKDVEIDPDRFYPRLRVRKVALGAAIVGLVAVDAFGVARAAIDGAVNVEGLLMMAFWVSKTSSWLIGKRARRERR